MEDNGPRNQQQGRFRHWAQTPAAVAAAADPAADEGINLGYHPQ